MFVKKTNHNEHLISKPPYPLHTWVSTALERTDKWVPNPERPRLLAYEDGQLKSIVNSDPPYLERGDVVWISYAVTFGIHYLNWGPDFCPFDVIRVGKMSNPDGVGLDYSGFSDDEVYRPLAIGTFVKPSDGKMLKNSTYCTRN